MEMGPSEERKVEEYLPTCCPHQLTSVHLHEHLTEVSRPPPRARREAKQKYTLWLLWQTTKRQTGKQLELRWLVSCTPAPLPRRGETKHGEDFVRLVPPEASEAGTRASIKHVTSTKYAVLHRRGPHLPLTCIFNSANCLSCNRFSVQF